MSDWVIKLLIATVAGVVLGIEREAKHKPLGLKTCVVIAVTSCLLTIVSIETAFLNEQNPFIRSDPMRLSAQIVSGIGFLGAGVILRRNNDVISGLTTAAIVWTASGIGIAVGAGYFKEVAVSLILIVISIRFLPFIVTKLGPHTLREQEVKCTIFMDELTTDVQQTLLEIENVIGKLRNIKINNREKELRIDFISLIEAKEHSIITYYDALKEIEGIKGIEIHGR
ncbi:MAG TPA: MgtC/SapB family protein [Candidatus Pseudogracilibacillus intestinigallinarum]|uniref:MgtC/SapB family protein n=1 Tax=Candidatus Pseudogracilibacillus intestinigallinarum TaxID=2838742 RepID=A0A9D1PLM1_9BACI|nr:MgtC/SapB family protein [Candidatus Pseudogracilibacillus intestinigallinarum]